MMNYNDVIQKIEVLANKKNESGNFTQKTEFPDIVEEYFDAIGSGYEMENLFSLFSRKETMHEISHTVDYIHPICKSIPILVFVNTNAWVYLVVSGPLTGWVLFADIPNGLYPVSETPKDFLAVLSEWIILKSEEDDLDDLDCSSYFEHLDYPARFPKITNNSSGINNLGIQVLEKSKEMEPGFEGYAFSLGSWILDDSHFHLIFDYIDQKERLLDALIRAEVSKNDELNAYYYSWLKSFGKVKDTIRVSLPSYFVETEVTGLNDERKDVFFCGIKNGQEHWIFLPKYGRPDKFNYDLLWNTISSI